MMDEHDGEEVIFLGFEQYRDRDLKWRYLYDDEATEYQNRISQKARKALRGAKAGDRIRIEFSFDAYLCPIRRAMRISGTDRENIRLLEARVESLEHRLEEVLRTYTPGSYDGRVWEGHHRILVLRTLGQTHIRAVFGFGS